MSWWWHGLLHRAVAARCDIALPPVSVALINPTPPHPCRTTDLFLLPDQQLRCGYLTVFLCAIPPPHGSLPASCEIKQAIAGSSVSLAAVVSSLCFLPPAVPCSQLPVTHSWESPICPRPAVFPVSRAGTRSSSPLVSALMCHHSPMTSTCSISVPYCTHGPTPQNNVKAIKRTNMHADLGPCAPDSRTLFFVLLSPLASSSAPAGPFFSCCACCPSGTGPAVPSHSCTSYIAATVCLCANVSCCNNSIAARRHARGPGMDDIAAHAAQPLPPSPSLGCTTAENSSSQLLPLSSTTPTERNHSRLSVTFNLSNLPDT